MLSTPSSELLFAEVRNEAQNVLKHNSKGTNKNATCKRWAPVNLVSRRPRPTSTGATLVPARRLKYTHFSNSSVEQIAY